MEKLKIERAEPKIKTLNRTIRIKVEVFDAITELSEKTDVSFNKLINQILEYGLANLDESEK